MAWNPTPEIAALRDFGKKFDRPVVVVFSLAPDGNQFHVSTYGKSKALCKLAGEFGDEICRAVRDGHISPPEVDPLVPADESQTWQKVPRQPKLPSQRTVEAMYEAERDRGTE